MTQFQDLEGLTSLAILKVNWDANRSSYLDNFLPFVKEALRRLDTDTVSAPTLRKELTGLTGLEIPQPVVSQLLKRARKKAGWLRHSQQTYTRTEAVFEGESLDSTAQGFQRKTTKLVEHLQSFAEKEYGIDWDESNAEQVLFDYLKRLAAPVVKATRSGSAQGLGRDATKKNDYVVSAFIQRCINAEPELFEYLESLAIGNMVASAVYYENPNTVAQSYDDVDIFLDTPLLLFILGVNGEAMREAYLEFVDLLKEAGANLCAFKITIDETRRVLDATASNPLSQRQARIPSASNPVQSQLPSSDLRLMSQQLEVRLKQMQITPTERPDYEAWLSKTVSEKDLEERLRKRYSDDKPDMLRHDVQAAISIHYIRKGRKPGSLTSADAIFVTNNSFLVWMCTGFFMDELGSAAKDVPHCMMYDELATRTWLMSPNPNPTLPRKQLLAHAYAAMLPEDGLVEKYLAELERLVDKGQISQDSYLYFRSAEGIGEILTDVTFNDEEAFTEATVQEIIKRKEAEMRAQTEEQREEQRRRAVAAEQEAERERREKEQLEKERRAEQERAQKAEEGIEARDKAYHSLQEDNDALRDRVVSAAAFAKTAVNWGLRLLLFAAFLYTVYLDLPTARESPETWVLSRTAGVALCLVVGIFVSFVQAWSWSQKAGDWVEQGILRYFSVPPAPNQDEPG